MDTIYNEVRKNRRGKKIMIKKIFQLEPLICPSCSAKIEGMLKEDGGIGESEVLFNSSRVKVSWMKVK